MKQKKCRVTQMSRLNTVQSHRSGVQGTQPNHRHRQDQCELDCYNCESLSSHSFNKQQSSTFQQQASLSVNSNGFKTRNDSFHPFQKYAEDSKIQNRSMTLSMTRADRRSR